MKAMPAPPKYGPKNPITSKPRRKAMKDRYKGYSKARRYWVCTVCGEATNHKPIKHKALYTPCKGCGQTGKYWYFQSKPELDRFRELRLLTLTNEITNLRSQVTFDLRVDGHLVTTYRADFVYFDNRTKSTKVEDVKPLDKTIWQPHSVLKISLFNAINAKHGLKVDIVARKAIKEPRPPQ